jgi:hypothetical protein
MRAQTKKQKSSDNAHTMRPAAFITLCLLAWTAVTSASASSASKDSDPAARVAALLADVAAGELPTVSHILAASKNLTAWTAWAGGEAVKALPPPIPAYALPGPCTVAPPLKGVTSGPLVLPAVSAKHNKTGNGTAPLDKGEPVKLLPTLTLPANCSASSARTAPWPVVVFYSGFSVS